MKYSGKMDPECIKLCDVINKMKGLRTTESCCGHEKDLFKIWFEVTNLNNLPVLLYFCDSCHVGFDWDCTVSTDCAMSPVHFRLSSRVSGPQAYVQANKIADEIVSFFKDRAEQDEH